MIVAQAEAPSVIATPTRMSAVLTASSVGTIIEWYDFLIYGTAAALVFNKLFFPSIDPTAGTLAAFGSFAVGFGARPLGGVLFGHFGDRLGRRMLLIVTLLTMGLGTFLIGCLPTYERIGVWAPIALVVLRLFQGLGLGGEWGGSSTFVLEHAPHGRRGLYGSLVQIGFPIGMVLASLAFAAASLLPDKQFMAWGWRLPFLFSGVLVAVGTALRVRMTESPVFAKLKQENKLAKLPVVDAVVLHPRAFLTSIGLKLSEVSWIYMLTVFMVYYCTSTLGMPKKVILDAILVAAVVELVTIPFFGWLSDAIGRRPMYILGSLITVAISFPIFTLLETRDPAIVMATVVVAMSLGHGMMFAPESAYFPELFGANVRLAGASFGFQLSAAIGGGLAPIAAAALSAYMGGSGGVSLMLIGLALVTLIAALAARETRHDQLLH